MHKADLCEKVEAGKGGSEGVVRCLACKHYCLIPEGETGVCGVRMNKGGDLQLMVYGYPVAVHLDPMEKKPLYHFLPGEKVLSLGTVGCNLSCKFCQNWDISQSPKILKRKFKDGSERRKGLTQLCEGKLVFGEPEGSGTSGSGSPSEPDLDFIEAVRRGFGVQKVLEPAEVVAMCEEGGVGAIAYTYNEPTIFLEYARDIGKLAREKGVKNIFVTSGYESPEALDACKGWLDAMNIDLKSFRDEFYRDLCGVRLEGVLETIRRAVEMGIWVEVTTLVIEGVNDSDEELGKIAAFLAGLSVDIPWHVTAFHPCYRMKDREATSLETLNRAREIGLEAGLRYVYTGNVVGGADDTDCPKCGELLIERWGMRCKECKVSASGKGDGECFRCGGEIAGSFCSTPGE
jgi:pyruvate formate lyase activating enzyme